MGQLLALVMDPGLWAILTVTIIVFIVIGEAVMRRPQSDTRYLHDEQHTGLWQNSDPNCPYC